MYLKLEIYRGRAFINIISAKNLPPFDFMGMLNPYVVITVDSSPEINRILSPSVREKKVKSKVQSGTLFPVWNETFDLDVSNMENTSRIIVKVHDHNTFGKDHVIGCTSWSLAEIKQSKVDGTYRLHDKEQGTKFNELISHRVRVDKIVANCHTL